MANKMLIDASHPEETRVVVVRGSRIEEFDFESEHKKQLKGNIYLAKVTRVEPSLQAAFVEYGGNRHGFLAFSEIHPDYYQIPYADRQALLEEEARSAESEEQEEAKAERPRGRGKRMPAAKAAEAERPESVSEDADADAGDDSQGTAARDHAEEEQSATQAPTDPAEADSDSDSDSDAPEDGEAARNANGEDEDAPVETGRKRRRRSPARNSEDESSGEDEADAFEEIGAEDALEEVPVRQRAPRRQYKIQEVIKRRQILLVQVVKEERGNKGAALTTYLSLAGRYSVLMPNTARGGGISRKITNAADRKRLKEIARELDVPKGMGIILRTAGANRTKAEIKRDYEYLMRLWETVRTLTLASTAPTLVYEEGSLIKRSIRDLYNKDIDQILVSGEDGYREAKDFMRMLMPSQAKVVQPYRDPVPIFTRQGIEAQLDRMLQPNVTLKSGGYIIINQTEALVAIDVNSGRSTREHSIEDTAYQTNLEAAEEIARQLRLRDLAGLIVIDFIDMDEKRNNRNVEKKLKDCLKNDRARIQLGRISHFGLMEMSRQRIRASVLESTMQVCPTCEGAGHIRSSSSLALRVLRTIEEHLQKHSDHDLIVKVPTATALYILNDKRHTLDDLERRYGLRIYLEADDHGGQQAITIDHGDEAERRTVMVEHVRPEVIEMEVVEAPAEAKEAAETDEEAGEDGKRDASRRRKRRGRRKRDGEADASPDAADGETPRDEEAGEDERAGEPAAEEASDDQGKGGRKRRRRGRRGGRRNRDNANAEGGETDETPAVAADADLTPETATGEALAETQEAATLGGETADEAGALAEAPAPADAVEAPSPEVGEPAPDEAAPEVEQTAPATEDESLPASPNAIAANTNEAQPAEAETAPASLEDEEAAAAESAEPRVTSSSGEENEENPVEPKPKRTGWWARRRSFF